jgi:hypothetical protein
VSRWASKCTTAIGCPYTSFNALKAGSAMLWSPPSVSNLGFFKYCTPLSVLFSVEGLFPSSRNASLICFRANVLSNGVIGMSPQSTIFAHDVYGFRFARGLKPRKDVWREEPARMARGPKRAPGRYETAVSKGAPRMAMSYVVSGWVKQRVCGRCAKVEIPEKPHCNSSDGIRF